MSTVNIKFLDIWLNLFNGSRGKGSRFRSFQNVTRFKQRKPYAWARGKLGKLRWFVTSHNSGRGRGRILLFSHAIMFRATGNYGREGMGEHDRVNQKMVCPLHQEFSVAAMKMLDFLDLFWPINKLPRKSG